jgi:hypothetical protein
MRRVTAGAALAAAVLALSGCGVSGTDFRPGVAAQVGDVRLYSEDVDAAVDGACDFITEQADAAPADPTQAAPEAQRFQRSALRAELLQLLVQRAAVEQLLEENDLEVGSEYQAQLAAVEAQFDDATEAQANGLRTGNEAFQFVQSGLVVLGTELLQDDGQQVDPSQPDAAAARGFEELSQWLLDHEVEINPVYGVSLGDDGALTTESDETSVVVSDEARFGMAAAPGAEPDEEQQAYIDSLPASQTCG